MRSGAGWSCALPLDHQRDVAWVASTKIATTSDSAAIPMIAWGRFCPPRTCVDMIGLLPPGGTFARRVGVRLLPPGFGTVAGSTTVRLRGRDPSRTAGRVVGAVGDDPVPFLGGEAPSRNLAR